MRADLAHHHRGRCSRLGAVLVDRDERLVQHVVDVQRVARATSGGSRRGRRRRRVIPRSIRVCLSSLGVRKVQRGMESSTPGSPVGGERAAHQAATASASWPGSGSATRHREGAAGVGQPGAAPVRRRTRTSRRPAPPASSVDVTRRAVGPVEGPGVGRDLLERRQPRRLEVQGVDQHQAGRRVHRARRQDRGDPVVGPLRRPAVDQRAGSLGSRAGSPRSASRRRTPWRAR